MHRQLSSDVVFVMVLEGEMGCDQGTNHIGRGLWPANQPLLRSVSTTLTKTCLAPNLSLLLVDWPLLSLA